MEFVKIYAAGKISRSDWRLEFFRDRQTDRVNERTLAYISNGELEGLPVTSAYTLLPAWPEIPLEGGALYVGPHFISDDHGCYHGPNFHGSGAEGWPVPACKEIGPCGAAYPSVGRGHVYSRCIETIDRSTHVVAWLDDPTAYGTLFELGYAKAKGKHITIMVPEDLSAREDLHQLWFTLHSSDRTIKTCCPRCGVRKFMDDLDLRGALYPFEAIAHN